MAIKDPRCLKIGRLPCQPCNPILPFLMCVLSSSIPHGSRIQLPSILMMDDYRDEEPLTKLVESLGEDYPMVLVKEAIAKVPDFIKTVEKQAKLDPFSASFTWNQASALTTRFSRVKTL